MRKKTVDGLHPKRIQIIERDKLQGHSYHDSNMNSLDRIKQGEQERTYDQLLFFCISAHSAALTSAVNPLANIFALLRGVSPD